MQPRASARPAMSPLVPSFPDSGFHLHLPGETLSSHCISPNIRLPCMCLCNAIVRPGGGTLLEHPSAQHHLKLPGCKYQGFGVFLSPSCSKTYSDTVQDRGDPGCLRSWMLFAIRAGLGAAMPPGASVQHAAHGAPGLEVRPGICF